MLNWIIETNYLFNLLSPLYVGRLTAAPMKQSNVVINESHHWSWETPMIAFLYVDDCNTAIEKQDQVGIQR